MLIESGVPLHFLGETILTACYDLNKVHIKSHTPQLLICQKDISQIWNIWEYGGCLAYVRLINPKMPKLGIRATICAFLGYAINSAVYRFFDLKNKIIF